MIDVAMLRKAVDPSSLRVARPVVAELTKIAALKSFGNDRGGAALLRASALVAVFGGPERSALLAASLRVPDPTLPHTQRTRQRGAYATSCFAAARDDVPPPVEDRVSGWSVRQPLLDGLALRHYIDRSAAEREVDEFMPVSGHLDGSVSDMAILSTMWLFGGSEHWPIPRIEVEWDRNANAIRGLPGYLAD
ncbi:hypothetical protein [Curtobacterium sp. MCBA15_001]|uniref:hypothetical protein n=1 Tax=Curtobacterium sp. MCBA15_001 TaxID=1898731 RepID=UPI0008DD0E62|nr:hypothetical protein [Curtobacterium sp. MCBA15_001]OIH98187.1 hypothetical protein BIU90_12500 [Curtobacterium sp. MCBA15_001]